MKLRLYGNSLRLRLNQAEVAQFSKTGYVEETIEFAAGARLSYVLESTSKAQALHAVYWNGELRIQVPAGVAMDWITTDRVGISSEQPVGNGKQLSILIEKDFVCIHRDEHDSQAYPNPMAARG